MADAADAEAAPVLQSRAELEANLAEYEEQLQQVDALLTSEPGNAEYMDIKAGLAEVIALTQELVRDAAAAEEGSGGEGGVAGEAAPAAPGEPAPAEPLPPPAAAPKRSRWEVVPDEGAAAARPPPLVLPPDDEEAVGEVAAAAATGADGAAAQPPPPKRSKPGGPAPTSATASAVPAEMPAWMVIHPDDDEATRAAKLKRQKAFKGKQRLAALDVAATQKAASWQAFAAGKGAKAKPGFMSTMAKPSMFSTGGRGARVGGVAAGRGGGGGGGGRGAPAPAVVRRGVPPPPVRRAPRDA
jgi:hypothetical protein